MVVLPVLLLLGVEPLTLTLTLTLPLTLTLTLTLTRFRDARTGNSTVTAASPPLSELKRDNVLDWLAWSLWGTNYDRMGAGDRAELSLVFSMLEARLGEDTPGTPADGQAGSSQAGLRLPFRFPPGRAPHVSSMQLEPRPFPPYTPLRARYLVITPHR